DAKPLAQALGRSRTFLSFESSNDLGSEEEGEYCRRVLDVLGLSLVLPLRSRDRLVGMLGCRPDPAGGALVSASDLALLSALADRTAVAAANALRFEL